MTPSDVITLPPSPKSKYPWTDIVVVVVVVAIGASWYLHPEWFPIRSSSAPAPFPNATLNHDYSTKVVTSVSNLETDTALTYAVETPAEIGNAAMAFFDRPEVSRLMGLSARSDVDAPRVRADTQLTGYNVVRLQTRVGGLRVFGGDVTMSFRSGAAPAFNSLSGWTAIDVQDNTSLATAIDQAEAERIALRYYRSLLDDPRGGLRLVSAVSSPPELLYFDPGRLRLGGDEGPAWRMRVGAIEMFISASSGELVFAYDLRHSVLHRRTSDCGNSATCQVIMEDKAKPPKPPVDAAVTAIHTAAGGAHQYFLKLFNRNGFDDSGAGGTRSIESSARVASLNGAQWLEDESRFEYGDGWTTPDIVAHEYAHAVTQYGPGLIYAGESGAVNEFFSDFFSVMIERQRTNAIDWKIGKGVRGYAGLHPLRNMADPHMGAFNPDQPWDIKTNYGQPEHMGEFVTMKQDICACFWKADNACVHFNSGILSRAAVLAVDGGSLNGVTVSPIGADKAQQIFYRTWMGAGVTSSSGLRITADIAITSCEQLIGQFGITKADCASFAQAFVAVGLH